MGGMPDPNEPGVGEEALSTDPTLQGRPDASPADGRAGEAPPARCPQCGRDVPVMEALVYHGVVYHPACVIGPAPR
jgi:hypothetical protein